MPLKIKRTKTIRETINEGEEYTNRKFKVTPSSGKIRKEIQSKRSIKIKTKDSTKLKPKNAKSKKNTHKKKKNQIDIKKKIKSDQILESLATLNKKQINYNGTLDIVFCFETTSFMNSYFEKITETILAIISKITINRAGKKNLDLKFGFVGYRDHPPHETSYLTKIIDLCAGGQLIDLIQNFDCSANRGPNKAVLDGLYSTLKEIKWREQSPTKSLKYIIHLADAPPHGKMYEKGGHNYWGDLCSCDLSIIEIGKLFNENEFRYRLVKTGDSLERMGNIFKDQIKNFKQTQVQNANTIVKEISNMIFMELLDES